MKKKFNSENQFALAAKIICQYARGRDIGYTCFGFHGKEILTDGEYSVQLISLYQLDQIHCFYNIIFFYAKHAILTRRSTVSSLPFQ
jgi:hypothetical protein